MYRPIQIVSGPTASGKTNLAMDLAEKNNGVLINADSRQIYKGLYIGTNVKPFIDSGKTWKVAKDKLSSSLLKQIDTIVKGKYVEFPIYSHKNVQILLVGFLELERVFNAFLFKEVVEVIIEDVIKSGKIPILVGGTGMYLEALIRGYYFEGSNIDPEFRKELEKLDLKQLQHKLEQKDKKLFQSLNNSDKNNKYRLIRLVEKLEGNGRPDVSKPKFKYELIQPNYDWEKLKLKINKRAYQMFDEGLVGEVSKLLEVNPSLRDSFVMQGIGYREVIKYLDGKIDIELCKELVATAHRQYARRQRTWWRRFERLTEGD